MESSEKLATGAATFVTLCALTGSRFSFTPVGISLVNINYNEITTESDVPSPETDQPEPNQPIAGAPRRPFISAEPTLTPTLPSAVPPLTYADPTPNEPPDPVPNPPVGSSSEFKRYPSRYSADEPSPNVWPGEG